MYQLFTGTLKHPCATAVLLLHSDLLTFAKVFYFHDQWTVSMKMTHPANILDIMKNGFKSVHLKDIDPMRPEWLDKISYKQYRDVFS